MDGQPIAISSSTHAPASLPAPLQQLLTLRIQADSALNHPALEAEVSQGEHGPQAAAVRQALQSVLDKASVWKGEVTSRLNAEEEARGEFVLAWALGRIGEYDGCAPAELPGRLTVALEHYQHAARLLSLPEPPALEQVPSVTRPKEGLAPLVLPEVAGWVGEMLAEWARTQTTLAFSSLLLAGGEQVIDEGALADMLDIACRRNVQGESQLGADPLSPFELTSSLPSPALFTPLDPTSPSATTASSEEAGTVMGNARLIRDMSTLMPFSSHPSLWSRRIHWATHVADVRFVEASMSANRLVDAASAAAAVLQDKTTDDRTRNEVRHVLEATIRRLVPFERAQGGCLLVLGRVMLEAVGALYLGRDEALLAERRRQDSARDANEEEEGEKVPVPENELVRETRQVFIRGEFALSAPKWSPAEADSLLVLSRRPLRERLRFLPSHTSARTLQARRASSSPPPRDDPLQPRGARQRLARGQAVASRAH